MSSFVIEYNRRTGKVRVTEFGAGENRQAVRLRLELERERTSKDVEVVSLVSDSIDSVRRTHSRYFERELVDQ